ncbi:vgr related protein [Novosphingobium sp.]|uniref:vgr related protein n=1 Tax=Novosphingobium sp. TaxID=1874826 RepID=UPI00261ABB43|nr:vgr related protein [Novosphingobium sp.]
MVPPGGERPLTPGEQALAQSVFGGALDLAPVRIRRRRFFPFQPRATVMAPMGHVHFHPASPHYHDDFAQAPLGLQALFIHELVHVWQTQQRGRFYLPLMRHPFCRYDYRFDPARPFTAYGIEQQAELVAHAFLAAQGAPHGAAPSLAALQSVLPFPIGSA